MAVDARGEGVVALGNLLQSEAVPAAMIAGFAAGAGKGVLEDRLIAAPLTQLAALWERWRPVAPTYRTCAIDPGSV